MIKAAKQALNRRSFLRAIPAVPLAAPSIAAEMAKGGGMNAVGYAAGYPMGADAACLPDDGQWFARRHAELLARSKGELTEEDEYYLKPNLNNVAAYHYDSLRSLSPTMRARLHADFLSRKARQDRMSHAAFELKQLLSQKVRNFF